MADNKKTFKVEVDGKDTELAIVKPNVKVSKNAQLAYNASFAEAVKSGALLKAKLQDVLIDQGVWSHAKQEQTDSLIQEINDNEQKLARGGIKLADAKKVALEMRVKRWRLRELISERSEYETNTAEGQAENARFNYLVAHCTVYNDSGKAYFQSEEDYLERSNEPAAAEAARVFANMMYGLDDNYEDNLPENAFLKEYNFVNDNLRLVDDEGELVDTEGHRVNEDGRYIDADGNFIDKDGNRVSEEGEYIFEKKPFLDDAGKPIVTEVEAEVEVEAETPAPKPKPKGRPKKKAPTNK